MVLSSNQVESWEDTSENRETNFSQKGQDKEEVRDEQE